MKEWKIYEMLDTVREGILKKIYKNETWKQPYRSSLYPRYCAPKSMVLNKNDDSGVFFGIPRDHALDNRKKRVRFPYYAGMRSTDEGNIMVIGGIGSGKSHVIGKSTLITCKDQMVILDIKGELSQFYRKEKERGTVSRNFLVFDPINGGAHYDPFETLDQVDEGHLARQVEAISIAIIPEEGDANDKYWIKMARMYLSAAIAYFYFEKINFSDAMLATHLTPLVDLCKRIRSSQCGLAKLFLANIDALNDKGREYIRSEVCRNLLVFVTDDSIRKALTCGETDEKISWIETTMEEDAPHVFIRVEQEFLEQWSGMIRLMITQLIHALERRPDLSGSLELCPNPILVVLDEFPQIGKMKVVADALATLRSKRVIFCIMIQDIAQLDLHYGKTMRDSILANCPFKVILRISELGSQKYLSELSGIRSVSHISVSQSLGTLTGDGSWSLQVDEREVPSVYPHDFGTNNDIIVICPAGVLRLEKVSYVECLQKAT